MGVSMLPRLAASVCRTTRGTASSSCWASFRTASPKGTKVMSDTSLVMAMLQKKGRNTNTSTMRRVEPARRSRALPMD